MFINEEVVLDLQKIEEMLNALEEVPEFRRQGRVCEGFGKDGTA